MFTVDEDRKRYLLEHLHLWMPVDKTPSEVGYRVADLLDVWVGGLHHLEQGSAKKVKWTDTVFIELNWRYGDVATFDSDLLTRLVFLSHDKCIRVSIEPVTVGMMRLRFHPRKGRDGNFAQRIPTLESAVASWRATHP